ncbi:MAG: hypothetical protein WBM24_05995 [Candidatus Sulfotelmatobacter sp.]
MSQVERPTFFYLFWRGAAIEIVQMTGLEAARQWDQGEHWVDMPQKTRADAEQLKSLLLSQRQQQ